MECMLNAPAVHTGCIWNTHAHGMHPECTHHAPNTMRVPCTLHAQTMHVTCTQANSGGVCSEGGQGGREIRVDGTN